MRLGHALSLPLCAALIGVMALVADARAAAPPVHGLWVGKSPTVLHMRHGAQALRDFCRSADINEVYWSVAAAPSKSDDRELGKLVALLHSANIRVEALLSSTTADAAGPARAKLLEQVRIVLHYDERHGPDRFDGIHLDIEPQQRPENKGAANLKFLQGLVDTYHEVRVLVEPRGLTVNADIQSTLLQGDVAERRALLLSLPRLTLLLHELSSPKDGKSVEEKVVTLRATSQRFLDMAYLGLEGPKLARMAIALRTPDYGVLLPQMLRTVADANDSNPHYLGWARHSYEDVMQRSAVAARAAPALAVAP